MDMQLIVFLEINDEYPYSCWWVGLLKEVFWLRRPHNLLS